MKWVASSLVIVFYILWSAEAVPEPLLCGDPANHDIMCTFASIIGAYVSTFCKLLATGVDMMKIGTCLAARLEPPVRNLFLNVFSETLAGFQAINNGCSLVYSWVHDVNGNCSTIPVTVVSLIEGLIPETGLIQPILPILGIPPTGCTGLIQSQLPCLLLFSFIVILDISITEFSTIEDATALFACVSAYFGLSPISSIANAFAEGGGSVLALFSDGNEFWTGELNSMCPGFSVGSFIGSIL